MTDFRQLFRRFSEDRKGNIAIIFSASLVPMLGFTGLAVDYGRASTAQTALNAAADAAALAAVSKLWDRSDPLGGVNVSIRERDARRLFNVTASSVDEVTIGDVTVSLSQAANAVTARVAWTGVMRTVFAPVIATNEMSLGGVAIASKPLPPFTDFTLLLDNSPSMGLAATTADIARLKMLTGGCQFGCHEPGNANDNMHIAHRNGVNLRIDVLRTSTQSMLAAARDAQMQAGQYRAGVYTFENNIRSIASTDSNLNNVISAANGIELGYPKTMDGGNNGSSDFASAFAQIAPLIGPAGDGSSAASRQQFLFFVSDGVSDVSNPACTWTHCTAPIDPVVCSALKARGVKIAVLYTTYLPMPERTEWQVLVQSFQNQIPVNMKACASSPDLYFEVDPDHGIQDAMQRLFQAAVNSTRLTN